MHKPEGDQLFTQIKQGLHRFDTRDEANYSFLTLKDLIRENYSHREYDNAKKARDMHAMVGYPSDGDYKRMIKHGLIHNCDVTVQDVTNATNIFGKSIFELKGKTARARPDPVIENYVAVPKGIAERHKNVSLCIDFMFVQSVVMLVTVSKNIKFTTLSVMKSRSLRETERELMNIINLYRRRGFVINVIHCDREFLALQQSDLAQHIDFNVVAMNEHVPEVERQIRVVKERIRCAWFHLPYATKPRKMVAALAKMVVLWLNNFTPCSNISETYSPRQIVQCMRLDMKKHCQLEFGTYAGAVVVRHQFTKVPLTQDVVDCVNALGAKDGVLMFLSFEDMTDDPAKKDKYLPPDDDEDSVFDFKDCDSEDDLTTCSGNITGVESGVSSGNKALINEESEDNPELDVSGQNTNSKSMSQVMIKPSIRNRMKTKNTMNKRMLPNLIMRGTRIIPNLVMRGMRLQE